ncbi:MAG: DUF2325 domain-containing protein [Achromobacter pulmonis]|uniref:DUF2325 domain-containing protein n=2 Tax=Achromobacter pulmonis TaxID=1389932 RepID=A0A6S7C2A6_9BURK|nr:DUF2325 domain-containing protein [Achromobacter pulmonis]MCF7770617.1 DUF2325 domain-containing protein [Achromobacter pulmonis]CAB3632990.1 hypothetical protein LMG26696_01122 [Achromobacter pulmonis]CAB3827576.1 hypothetical protein LMG26788_00597 [Achromobacter pulmonis]
MTLAFQAPNSLQREHAALLAAYGQAQARCSRLLSAQAQRIAHLEAEVFKLRAQVIQRDTALAWARQDRAALEGTIPGLAPRIALARRVSQLVERVQGLMRERLAWQDRAAQARERSRDRAVEPPAPAAVIAATALREKSVLCVGEDAMALMLTRKVVEMAGGRYLGHCGGENADAETLEASLVAADLVICQTGCVSHGAYWRVKDHCTRTGKQCVLVDKPEALTALGLARESAELPR